MSENSSTVRPLVRWLPSFKEGSFARNQSYMLSRNAVVLLAQLLFTPIIARLYAPEAYGTMNAVLSITALLLPFATLQYDRALLLARNEEDVQALRALNNLLPAAASLVILLALLAGGDDLLHALGMPAVGNMALLIPFFIVLTAWAQTSQQMVAVRMRYKQSFVLGSVSVVGAKLVAMAHGLWIGGGAIGLLLAEVFSRLSGLVGNSRFILMEPFGQRPWRSGMAPLLAAMRKFSSFPKFELPAAALAQVAGQVPLLWLPKCYGLALFGQFSLCLSLLEVPMRLFSYSMSVTFYQKAAQVYQTEGAARLRSITFRTMAAVSAASAVPMLLVALFAPDLFTWALGPQWTMAGRMAQALCVMYCARLTVEPVASVLRVIGKQHAYVWFHGLLLLLRICAAGLAVFQGSDILEALFIYALADAAGRTVLTLVLIRSLNHRARSAKPPSSAA